MNDKGKTDFSKYLDLAQQYSKNGNHKRSIDFWQKTVDMKPDFVIGWVMMGQEYEKLRQAKQAIECYDNALKTDPQNNEAQWFKEKLLAREKLVKSIEESKLLRSKAEVMYDDGMELLDQEKYYKAIYKFNKAIKENPESSDAWHGKGCALFAYNNISPKRRTPKKYEEAMKYIDKAIELNPKKKNYWFHKIQILNLIGPYEDAVKSCYEALRIEPNKFWLETAITHDCFKHYQEAIECIDKHRLNLPQGQNKFTLLEQIEQVKKMKSGLESGLKYGDNFYVPVIEALLQLSKAIPLKSEIIYSTKMKITWTSHYTRYRGQPQKHTAWLITKVLITPEGFACWFPTRRRPSSKSISPNHSPVFIPWSEARLPRRGHIKVGFKGEDAFIFRLVGSKLRESEREFSLRAKTFQNDIRRLRGFE